MPLSHKKTMSNIQDNLVKIVLAVILVVGGIYVITTGNSSDIPTSPSLSGTTNLDSLSLSGTLDAGTTTVSRLTEGGGVFSTSTDDTTPALSERHLRNYSYIEFTPQGGGGTTLSLPATSSLTSFVPNAGDTAKIIIENGTTTTGTDGQITISAGTGIILHEPDGQNVIIDGQSSASEGNYAVLEFWRRSDTDVVVTVDEHIPAD